MGQGKSSFIASPLTHAFLKWRTVHPDVDGMCRISIQKSSGEQFELANVKGYTDEGWFM